MVRREMRLNSIVEFLSFELNKLRCWATALIISLRTINLPGRRHARVSHETAD
jgi:hypothetical protein